jgi:WD40 repeat protein
MRFACPLLHPAHQAGFLCAGGIFSLHERGGWLLTASKDGTLAVSSLGGGGSTASLSAVQRYDDLHDGVVKCARWQPCGGDGGGGRVFASCGNDRRLCVVDARQAPSSGASLAVEGAAASALNCLRWHPASPHVLLSASHDPAVLLHDLRSPGQPLHRLLGHGGAAPRIAAIYQPAFVAGGAAVATGCERSQLLSLYCTASGAAISRGEAGLTPGATFCRGGPHDPLLCTAARAVYFFQPVWAAGRDAEPREAADARAHALGSSPC